MRHQRDAVRRDYARLAAGYEQRWRGFNEPIRAWVLAHWPGPPGKAVRVLDVGCGTGGLLAALVQTEPRAMLVGLDVTREQLTEAQRRAPRALLIEADARFPPFFAQSFDVVLSMNVLHHFDHPAAHIDTLTALLRPHGTLFLSTFSATATLGMRLAALWQRLRNPAWRNVLSASQLQAVLARDERLKIDDRAELRAGGFWPVQIYRIRRTDHA